MQGDRKGIYDEITDIFIRTKFLDSIKTNSFLYYEYSIKDSDTPEIIAEKFYDDPEKHWIIMLANDKLDFQYDWPLAYDPFNKYIIGKYGSIAISKINIDHYEKIITRVDSGTNITTISKIIIDVDTYTNLPVTTFNVYNLIGGTTLSETITKSAVTSFDKETLDNENKRPLKLIKKEHIGKIINQFETIMGSIKNIDSVLTE